jgi:hypothetical protein
LRRFQQSKDESDPKEKSRHRRRESLDLWGFVVVYLAVIFTSVLVLGLIILSGSKEPGLSGKPPPWDGFVAMELIFAVIAAVAVCVIPLVAGHVWKDQSDYFGRWGSRELRVYIPSTPGGWVGYYFAVGVSSLLVFLLLLAVVSLAVASAERRRCCPYCSSITGCPDCR